MKATGCRRLAVICLTLLGLSWSQAWADTWYVTDEFRITIRRGENATFRVVKSISTGTRLEVLEEGASGWNRVRTEDGLEGWVLKRYLSRQPPARLQLATAEEARAQAETERDQLRGQIADLKSQLGSQQALEEELERIRNISENALNLEQENRRLEGRVGELQTQAQQLQEEKDALEAQTWSEAFLAGAGVLALGFISGGLLARRRRSNAYGSLN